MLTDQTFFRFDDVTVDCKDFRVLKGVQKVDLTPRAFDDDANNPRYIETVPKRGYRFIAELSAPLSNKLFWC